MTGQQTLCGRAKSNAGAVLAGLGLFFLYQDLAGAVVRLRHVLGGTGAEAQGVPPAVMQALSQASQAHAANHILQCFLLHMLISSWPLLLVMAGGVLLRDGLMESVEVRPKNTVDLSN